MNQPAAFSPDTPEGADNAHAAPPELPQRDLKAALHEVANALTVVVGWLGRAQAGEAESLPIALDIAKKRAEQARTIVRRAIGTDTAAEPPVTAASIVREAVLGLEPEASRKRIVIYSQIKGDRDTELIEHGSAVLQILTNLLLNAISASPEGASIELGVEAAGPSALLFSVSDQGPGIAAERRATLFDAGKTTRAGGAGIGLRHAAALARDGQGELRLAGTERGARFELLWPSRPPSIENTSAKPDAERNTAPAAHAPLHSQSLAGQHILLVEDDEAIIELLDTVLTGRGASIHTVTSNAALNSALASNPGAFSAALVDLSPIRDNIAGAFMAMHQANPGIRVFFITGSASPLPSLPPSSHAAWIRKPFDVSEIISALVSAAEKNKATTKA